MQKYIMALDSGTTSNRCIIFNHSGKICSITKKEFTQHYPQPGYVEHDAEEIWLTQFEAANTAMKKLCITADDVAAIGITNQRETAILWDKITGKPVYNAIVWQCRRTAPLCDKLKNDGVDTVIKEKTGLILDAYFSATKIMWILDNVPGARQKAEKGELLFGTVETWLVWKLTNGKVHITDYSNASRTMLFNIHKLEWDKELLELFNIPESILPQVKPCSEVYCKTAPEIFGRPIVIGGLAGDQQSALFGQTCFEKGSLKCTFGTGSFLLMNTGDKSVQSKNRLITTIAWGIDSKITYALEGSVFIAGAAIQWLRDEMKIIESAEDTEYLAKKVNDTNDCYVVPAFAGLGAPYWDPYARGTIVGITRGVNKYHIVRATLESLAFQSYDIIKAMETDAGIDIKSLKVDGGACVNNLLLQMLSDIAGTKVQRPECIETTAMGAAYLAGLAVGYWDSIDEIGNNYAIDLTVESKINETERNIKLNKWHKAVKCAMNWAE